MLADPTIPEIIEDLKNGKNRLERAEILRKYDNRILREILRMAFDDRVTFCELHIPEYKPQQSDYGLTWSNLSKSLPRIRILLDDGTSKNIARLETVLAQVLECVHPREAEILIQIVKGKWKEKYLTKAVVEMAFPNLLPPK